MQRGSERERVNLIKLSPTWQNTWNIYAHSCKSICSYKMKWKTAWDKNELMGRGRGKLLENSILQCNKYFIANSIWWLCNLSTWHKVSQCPAPWEQCHSSWRVSSVQCSQCPYPPGVEVQRYKNNIVYSCLYSHANRRFQFAWHKAVSWCAKHQRYTKRRPIQLFFLNCKYIIIN